MKKALISVSNKSGIIPLAKALKSADYEIISTGGTAHFLSESGIEIIPIERVSGFPEILNGRVKTLHPKILGGILADSNKPEHLQELNELAIKRIDMVVVNLYPFGELYADEEQIHSQMIENIDIGGITLLRAAAKNYQSVTTVSDINDYQMIIEHLQSNKEIGEEVRLKLALKAFTLTSKYDGLVSQYLYQIENEEKPKLIKVPFYGGDRIRLRYGENPHQEGHYISDKENSLIVQLHGKELSYNNYLDIDAAIRLIMKFERTTAAIIKHTNPCGVASAESALKAYKNCFSTDTQSPFGGIVVVNKKLDMETAEAINSVFTEIIIAPEYDEEVLRFLKLKKNRRIIEYNPQKLNELAETKVVTSCLNGMLIQSADIGYDEIRSWKTVTDGALELNIFEDLKFAWKVVSALKSNAICLAQNHRTIGIGMGQTSRVDSMELAIRRAQKYEHSLKLSVCASDGFFPFRDSIDLLAEYGVKAIVQPGGSKGDEQVIEACNEHGIAMIFTGMRHFQH